ncbi:MAG: 37S ribosomal protein S9, mitochondrial [Peltula sp. TS41687]|nr:MAG: 37S ribosomal protein S9, mitochondrial [Peltula sp. TS41687]
MKAASLRQYMRQRCCRPIPARNPRTFQLSSGLRRGHTPWQSFSTTPENRAFVQQSDGPSPRLVPASPSYFTTQPTFTDDLLAVQTLLRRYTRLPVVPTAQVPRVAWKTLVQYRVEVGESVPAAKYHRIIEVLRRLNRINASLMPGEVRETIQSYKRTIDPYENRPKPQTVDRDGRSTGTGRRKASSARVWLVEGEGEVLINGKTLVNAFPRVHDRESAVWALKATGRLDKYNVWAIVNGGGTTGQAEALTLGVARALLVHEPMLKPALRRGE